MCVRRERAEGATRRGLAWAVVLLLSTAVGRAEEPFRAGSAVADGAGWGGVMAANSPSAGPPPSANLAPPANRQKRKFLFVSDLFAPREGTQTRTPSVSHREPASAQKSVGNYRKGGAARSLWPASHLLAAAQQTVAGNSPGGSGNYFNRDAPQPAASQPAASQPTAGNPAASKPRFMGPVTMGLGDEESVKEAPTFQPGGYLRAVGGYFHLVRQPAAPVQPMQPQTSTASPVAPTQPLSPTPALGSLATFGEGGVMSALQALPADRAPLAASIAPVVSATSAPALSVNARPQLAQAIADQDLAVQTIWRNALSEAPIIRGFQGRDIYAQLNGQYFEPVRWDLDTPLNKIDPGIVQDVIVVQGPYAVQYGPGFTFMDIVTRPTPRNQASQYRTSVSWIPNGQQIYGRETVSGGSRDFGYRLSYGHRNANDYFAGNGSYINSHYNFGDVLAELGYNLSTDQRIEFVYNRVDQNHTAYPGQFFGLTSLQTNAYNLRYIDEDVTMPWTRLTVQGWYNNNSMTGDTFNESQQPIVGIVDRALTNYVQTNGFPGVSSQFSGGTVGSIMSTGGRVVAQFGELDDLSLTTGIDVRVLNQRVTEYMTIQNELFAGNIFPLDNFTTGMPRADMVNPGAFAEMTVPWTSYFRSKIGGRGDYLYTHAFADTLPNVFGNLPVPNPPPLGALPAGSPLSKSNGLYAYYIVNQLDITQNWNAAFSFGESQRPPSLIDRYADGMFLGILQSGFRRVIGDPNLKPAKNYQIDAQINGKYDNWRGYIRGYNSWVTNFITYAQEQFADPTGARLLHTVNTPQAQLRGFEAFNSFDLTPNITPFASAHYVYGEDVTIHQALWTIPPLQAFAGLRFHDSNQGSRWGLEVFATMTEVQNRNGVIRVFNSPGIVAPIEQRVGGWTIVSMRGYWNVSRNLLLSGGINNIGDRNYIQYTSLQSGVPGVGFQQVLSPGISPYVSMEWIY